MDFATLLENTIMLCSEVGCGLLIYDTTAIVDDGGKGFQAVAHSCGETVKYWSLVLPEAADAVANLHLKLTEERATFNPSPVS